MGVRLAGEADAWPARVQEARNVFGHPVPAGWRPVQRGLLLPWGVGDRLAVADGDPSGWSLALGRAQPPRSRLDHPAPGAGWCSAPLDLDRAVSCRAFASAGPSAFGCDRISAQRLGSRAAPAPRGVRPNAAEAEGDEAHG
jgi:hypothetical protein